MGCGRKEWAVVEREKPRYGLSKSTADGNVLCNKKVNARVPLVGDSRSKIIIRRYHTPNIIDVTFIFEIHVYYVLAHRTP